MRERREKIRWREGRREEKNNKKRKTEPTNTSKSLCISHFTNKEIKAEIKKITFFLSQTPCL